jgi:hypothetical protein
MIRRGFIAACGLAAAMALAEHTKWGTVVREAGIKLD